MDQIEHFEWATRKASGTTTIWIRFATGLSLHAATARFSEGCCSTCSEKSNGTRAPRPAPAGHTRATIFLSWTPCSNDPHPHAEMRRASNQISCKKCLTSIAEIKRASMSPRPVL
jgi:hypothetical protein